MKPSTLALAAALAFGTSVPVFAGSYNNDFSSGVGAASLRESAVLDSGSVRLTPNVIDNLGSLVINDLDPGSVVTSFDASFTLAIGPGAQSDIATAQAAQTAAQGVQTAATTLKGQADALAAARTGDVQLLAQGISALAAQMSSLAQQVAGIQAWRQAVDANAVATDQAVIYLGRIAGRYI